MRRDRTSRTIRGSQARKFIHYLMSDGKRKLAERIFDASMEKVRRSIHGSPSASQILNGAIENARPFVVIRRQRVGGIEYDVPVPVSEKRNRALAIWAIIETAHGMSEHGTASRLAEAILVAYRNG